MWRLGGYFIVPENEMDELLRDKDRYYKYEILAEMRQDDTKQQLEEALENLKKSK